MDDVFDEDHVCDDPTTCGYDPEECDICKDLGHACWYDCGEDCCSVEFNP